MVRPEDEIAAGAGDHSHLRVSHADREHVIHALKAVIVRWLYSWADEHVRGVDLLRVRAGRVAETLAYVKG
jgi:hypothetical protein